MTDNELLLAISDIMDKKIHPLEVKISSVEESLSEKIDAVEKSLNDKINFVEKSLNDKIDSVEQNLNAKIDSVEQNLNAKIDSVERTLQNQIIKINLHLENNFSPRLQNIEDCYLSTYERYKNRNEQLDQLQLDVSVIKRVVIDHSERLKQIS